MSRKQAEGGKCAQEPAGLRLLSPVLRRRTGQTVPGLPAVCLLGSCTCSPEEGELSAAAFPARGAACVVWEG